MKIIKEIYRLIIPLQIKKIIRKTKSFMKNPLMKIKLYFLIKNPPKRHRKALGVVRRKDQKTVAFFVIHASVWKYDELFKILEKDFRYNPIIVICPFTSYNEVDMIKEMNMAYKLFQNKNYQVINTYNHILNEWMDVKEEINPDVVFFTNPHNVTLDKYLITNFTDILTCYVQYSFPIMHLYDMQFNLDFHNLLWKAFYETKMHKRFAQQYARNKGNNVRITGYPGTDILLDKNHKVEDHWKIKDRAIKRIIWAPHHTIKGQGSGLDYSCFVEYADFMVDMANKYQDKIQIAFKPHPILKPKLVKDINWGEKRTEDYYKKWDNLSNGQLNESEYVDLFLTSDAMIHDSASFLVEYLYVNKPVQFTIRDSNVINRFNEFGKLCYDMHYQASTEKEIVFFIEKVIGNQDDMEIKRNTFIDDFLIPPNNKSASENIYIELNKSLIN
jgi:hypothetical protein